MQANLSILFYSYATIRDKWVSVTLALRVLRLRMEERPPIWRVAANILNKQSRTPDKGWSSSLGVGRGGTTPRRKNVPSNETFIQQASDVD